MKKILSLFVAVMLLFTTLTITSFAADTATVTVVGADGAVGDTVSLKVKLNTSGPVNTIALKSFEYNKEVLEFVGFADYSYLTDNKALPETLMTDPVFASFALKNSVVFDSSNEDIISLEFKVLKEQKAEVLFVPVVKDNTLEYDVTIAPAEVNASAGVIDITSVELDKTTASLTVGENLTLKATINPSDATSTSVTWSSDNESVATVSNLGKVEAKKAGTAVITAKAGDHEASCTITVKAKQQSSSGGGSSSGSSSGSTVVRPSTGTSTGSSEGNSDSDKTTNTDTAILDSAELNNKDSVSIWFENASANVTADVKDINNLSVSLKIADIELDNNVANNVLGNPLSITVDAKNTDGESVGIVVKLDIASENEAYAYVIDKMGNLARCESVYNKDKAQVEIKAVENNTIIVLSAKKPESFTDAAGRWSQAEIEKANDRGLANGRGNGIFEPSGNLTRHESNKLHMNIVNAVKADLAKDDTKSVDTSNDNWAYESDLWAVQVGISNGTSRLDDGTVVMSGENNITRQDYITSIYRMMKLVLGDVAINGEAIEFADAANIADYAKDAIAYLSSLGIVKGSQADAGVLVNPTSQITREEAVAILNRVYDAILALN